MIEDYPTSEGYVEFPTRMTYRRVNGRLEKIRVPYPPTEATEAPEQPVKLGWVLDRMRRLEGVQNYHENKLNEHLGRRKNREDQPQPRAKGGIEISTNRLRQGFGG